MRIIKTVVVLLILSLLYGCSNTAPKKLKVMTWNIWHGGLHGPASADFEKDSTNTVNVLKVLQEQDPDVLLMQETYCCGMEIAKQAGYEYSWRGSSNLSIHSKYPIIDSIEIFKSFNSTGVVLEVHGEKLMVLNIWLHYLPDYFQDVSTMSVDSLILGEEATRLSEIRTILSEIDSLENIYHMPIIIGGDFNSGSHLDWIESTKEWHYDKVIAWPVSKAMIENGFTDSFRAANPDPLKTMEGTWGFLSDDIISDRIDYIYYKGDALKTLHSKIVMEDPDGGFFNSDHRAILTEFEIQE